MNDFFKKILPAVFVIISIQAFSQNVQLSGKIKNAKNEPIAGASVYLLNTAFITVANADGAFTFNNMKRGNYTVEVKAIGYATISKDIAVNTAQDISLQMEESSAQLDEVVVSAQKYEERLQKVPASITALSERQINDYRIWNSKDITAIVPDLYSANPGDGRNVTSIRGITSTSYDPAVATYIDGVNQFSLDTYIPQLFDVESIEVLRGPQGTLYGRNAMGGVINIITKKPSNSFNAFAELNFGNYGQQRFSAGIKAPLIKNKLFFGAAGLYTKLDGFYTNEFNNSKFDKQHNAAGNYYLKYIAGERWFITLNFKHTANRNNGAFPLVQGIEDAFLKPFMVNQDAVTQLVDNSINTSLVINHAGSNINFNSQTAWQSNYRYYDKPIDGDFSPIDGITIINNYGSKWNNVKVFTQELKFASPASSVSKLKWTTGAYFYLQNNPNKQAVHFGEDAIFVGSPDINYAIINTTKGKNAGAALYGQFTYSISNVLRLTAGLRYDYEHKKLSALGEYKPDESPGPIFETRPDTSATATYSAVSPMLSFAYDLNDKSNLYVSYNRGFRTGGLTQLGADPSQPPLYQYKPEYSNNFELGLKNSLLKNRLRMNFSVFYTNIMDAQIPTLVLPDAVTVTKNAGKLSSKGFEAELNALPVKGLELTCNFGYTDARYDDLKLPQEGVSVNHDGNRQIFTPDITSMLAAQYSIALSKKPGINMVLRGEWYYLGSQYFDLKNTIRQSPYQLLNVRAGISTKNIDLMFWARNITDKLYMAYAYDFGAVHLGNPKTYGVTCRIKF